MKPTAVILSAATGYGGAERSLETLLPFLARDHNIRILVQNDRHLQACRRIAAGGSQIDVSVLRGGPSAIQLMFGMLWLVNIWMRHRPHFVLANNNKSAMLVALTSLAVPSMARRAILYVRDFEWRYRRFIFTRLWRALFLIPSRALLDTRGYLDPWVKPRGRSRCEVVMNAVAIETRAPSSMCDAPYIVLAGTVQEWKGHEYVVQALARTSSSLRAIFVGDIQDREYFARLITLAKALGVSERIEFREFDPDIFRVFSGSLCVVVASIARAGGPETFGRAVIEAWVARRPVVAFACGGPLYLIKDRETGILVPPEDADALGAAIAELMENRHLAEKLVSAGHRHVQDFAPDRIYGDFRNAIETYLHG